VGAYYFGENGSGFAQGAGEGALLARGRQTVTFFIGGTLLRESASP